VPSATYEAVWGRVFATAYDAAFVPAEMRGFRSIRRELAGQATGKVLELGAGTGLNLDHYPQDTTELILTEPNPHMASKLRKRVRNRSEHISILESPAEALPMEDASVDTIVSTLVLCTVADPHRTLAEVARVLRPGGRFLFAEHVRSESPKTAQWQDRLNRAWGWFACGCQCNRDTVSMIENSPLDVVTMRTERLHWVSPLVRPLVVGVASRSNLSDVRNPLRQMC
jgi:ubiquinone/menaquinone biosynthesis C-methylase UbiE